MKYASFYRKSKPSFEIDEYNLYFDPQKNSYDKLVSFCSKHEKRINLLWDGEYDLDKIKALNKITNELVIRVTSANLGELPDLIEEELDYFLDISVPIHSFTMLEWVYQIKPKEIYITDDLLYYLEDVARMCHKNGIRLRMILNRAPVTEYASILSPTAPIFSPKDLPLLDLYFDTYEFDFSDNDLPFAEFELSKIWKDAEETCYRIWFIDNKWDGKIRYLNKDVTYNYSCKDIPLQLNYHRIKCHHRCVYRESEYPCSLCDRSVGKALLLTEGEEEDDSDD